MQLMVELFANAESNSFNFFMKLTTDGVPTVVPFLPHFMQLLCFLSEAQ
jgi:hypothetical protein